MQKSRQLGDFQVSSSRKPEIGVPGILMNDFFILLCHMILFWKKKSFDLCKLSHRLWHYHGVSEYSVKYWQNLERWECREWRNSEVIGDPQEDFKGLFPAVVSLPNKQMG